MDNALDDAGALATATAAATVIGAPASHREAHGEACLNCGAAVNGAYCASCGQQAHVHRSLGHAVEELLHGVWHFDSKLWNTLPLLAFRPGKLTRDYVMGRRARYISPMGLFLLTIFAMFFVFGLSGGIQLDPAEKAPAGTEGRATFDTSDLDKAIADVERDIAAARRDPARAADLPALKTTRDGFIAARRVARDAAAGKLDGADEAAWATALKSLTSSGDLNMDLGDETLNGKVRKALKNPELTFYKVQQKGYKLSFLLLPLSLPWMLLLFAWKRGVRAYDHVVFLLYSISFMSMLVMAVVLLAVAGVTWGPLYALLVVVVPPLHIYSQMKGAYALSGFSALWRTTALLLFSIVTLMLYFTLVLGLGLVD